jgi:hypothetical protein
MGLRFSCVAGWGWVAGMGGCIAECAHHLEKSAPDFRNASIHLLLSRQYFLRSKLRPLGLLRSSRSEVAN